MTKFKFAAAPLFAVVLWLSTVAVATVGAQQSKPAEQTSTGPTVELKTDDDLKRVLDNMGYAPGKLSDCAALLSQRQIYESS